MKKLKIIVLLCLGLLFPFNSNSQDQSAQVSVDFKINNFGITVNGTFTKANISPNFKSQDVSQWTLTGNVDVNSITTNNKKRDAHLLEDDYFDAVTFPKITLKSKRFKSVSGDKYDVTVNLTIKGITKTRVIPMTILSASENLEFKSDFEIDRRDFNVGGGSLVMSDTVRISVIYASKN